MNEVLKNTAVPSNKMMPSKKGKTFSNIWKARYLYILILPGLIYYLVFKYLPMFGVIIAFKDYQPWLGLWNGLVKTDWVGFANFRRLFSSMMFPQLMENTMLISFYKLFFGFPAPILLALLLNEVSNAIFKRSIQSISYVPHFLSWVVVGGILTNLLSPSYGVINGFLKSLGYQPIYFMTVPEYFRGLLVVTDVWKSIGWGSIIYLATLTGISPELYEAATIDGAGKWKQLLHITLPGLKSTIIIVLILRIGHVLDAGFDQILTLYNPTVFSVSDILDTYVYREGILNASYSFSTAVGLFKSSIGLVLVLITNYLSKKAGEEALW